jgi:hypothetical protein
MNEHGMAIIAALSIREDWGMTPKYNFVETQKNYYLDIYGGRGTSLARYKIFRQDDPYEVAEWLATGMLTPYKFLDIKAELTVLQTIKGFSRGRGRKALREYLAKASKNKWAEGSLQNFYDMSSGEEE